MDEAQRLIENFVRTRPITRYGKGQVILRPVDEVEKIHYILEGNVIQYDISESGNIVVVNTFRPGSLIPLSHAFTDIPLDYFFEADTPVSTRTIPKDRLIEFISNTPKVMQGLLSKSYQGSEELLRRLSHTMGGSATNRVIYELSIAADRIGEKNVDGSVFVRLSENDIARRTGLSRETVNRTLRDFKKSGTVKSTNRGIVITFTEEFHCKL